ncbi:uncharacterized protein C8Q71DRAFT_855937 [Rhodofomes roseus]|uniref:Uncharacterized protein n=1 Tax=Rhodofomes roseus TaxID=34475 RepID=A0ABQ8KM07_9APHY|nr:uncharacterized protein C8Q71DRAFT_855937 [Rhodofomes roseus]KAH9839310.1 hypothetical protein C8Q71DRAFT_855937 [Rhodofomes roseus]
MPLTAQEVTASAVMESPLAAPLSSAPPPALPLPLHRRRVPRPVCHSIVRDPNLSGPVVVLVPDSDTSASLSQNQPFSQPSQQNTSLQEKSQDQKQSERSQQSLSYATDSQGDHSSKSDPKSQGSQQSRLRHEITAAVDEIVEGPVSSEAVVAEGSSQAVEPSQPVGAQPSSPPATVPDDAPDQGASPRKPEDVRDLTSVKPPPVRTRSKVTIPSPQEVPDSEDETEEDTGDEHDELESAAGTDIVSRRSAPLDSDDAKTKAMVDKYTAKPTTEVTAERVRERIGQSSSASDLPAGTPQRKEPSSAPRRLSRRKEDTTASLAHSRSSELPLPPSSPDVFMSEDSFHASQASFLKKAVRPRRTLHKQSTPRAPTTSVCDTQLSDTRKAPATREVDTVSSDRMRVDMLPPPSTHDPEAWKEPAFMRKPSPVQADKPVSKASVAIQVDPPKRRRSPSPASEPERPPPKRRKTSTVSATRTSEWASRYAKTTDVIPPPRPRDTRPMLPPVPNRQPIAGPSTSFKQVDLPRSSSITSSVPSIARKRSTSGRSASSDKSTIAKPEVKIVRQLSPGGSTPVEIKHVDFRAGTRRSSLASISRTKTRSHPSADITPSNARGHRTTMVGYDTAPSTSRLGDRSRPVDPSPSTMKRASHVSTTYMMPMVKPRSARQNPTSSSSHNPPKPGGSSSMVKTKEGPSAATAAPPQKQLLGGYKVNLDMKREEGGPPPMTWARLQEILVSTGRARYKLKKEKEVREAKSNQDRRGGAG